MTTRNRARCRELVERLSLYIDGDLSGVERRAVTLHLRRCPCCDDFVRSLRTTVGVCRAAGRTRLPADVRARARARIARLLRTSRPTHGR